MSGGGRASPHEAALLGSLAGTTQQPFAQPLTLAPGSPRNIGELLEGQPAKPGGFFDKPGGQALNSILGMAITSLLGAGLGALSSPGARGLGAARGAGLGGLMGLTGDISQRRSASEIPANMAKFMAAQQKDYSHPLSVYMATKGITNPSTIDQGDFMSWLGQYSKLTHPMLPNEVSMLGPGFYGAIRESVLGGLKNKKGQPGIVQPAPGTQPQDYGEHPDITGILGNE